MSKIGTIASSKTYRKATGMVAEKMGIDPDHTRFPKDDFARIVEKIRTDPNIDEDILTEIAEKYYRIGVKGGLRQATDMMVDGHFFIKGNHCWVEGSTKVKRRIKLPNGESLDVKMKFSAEDLGFGDEAE